LARLFERYRLPVWRFLFGVVGHRDLAEDLAQETASRAFALLPNLKDEGMFSSWLFGIARNVAREKRRHASYRADLFDLDEAGAGDIADTKPGPETNAMRRQMYRAITRGFAGLNEDRRTALALRVLAEKTYREISAITGWSLARVKIEIHRARLEMRAAIGPFLEK
jgi:RNA polymerase sigma-70 factor (ECF subfamily)